jgi:hypothetical protein
MASKEFRTFLQQFLAYLKQSQLEMKPSTALMALRMALSMSYELIPT